MDLYAGDVNPKFMGFFFFERIRFHGWSVKRRLQVANCINSKCNITRALVG